MVETRISHPALTVAPAVLRRTTSPCCPFTTVESCRRSTTCSKNSISCRSNCEKTEAPQRSLATRLCTATAIVQMAIFPLTGSSIAALDTTTEPAGVGATIEASDITNEDQKAVLTKLREKILPEAKDMLTRVGKGEGSNYPSSIAKELETVDLEVNDLIQQANKGGDMSNIKSAASGIEQQVNALKAIVGFD